MKDRKQHRGNIICILLRNFIPLSLFIYTKREVKMAGYWPSCVFIDRNKVKVHKNAKKTKTKKKKTARPISNHFDRTSLVNKGFIIWPKDYIKEFRQFRFRGNKADNPEWTR